MTAKFGGTWVDVTVEISNVVAAKPVGESTMDITITEIDVYDGLTAGAIKDILGATGSRQGLYEVSDINTAVAPRADTYTNAANETEVKVEAEGGGDAFTIEPTSTPDVQSVKVEVGSTATTFKITTSWKCTVGKVKLKELLANPTPPKLAAIAGVVRFSLPVGSSLQLPEAQTIHLVGAKDPQPLPPPAQATPANGAALAK